MNVFDSTTGNARRRSVRRGAAVAAAALLVSSAVWHGRAAESRSSGTPATHAVSGVAAGGDRRDSYADIVRAVSPAVVTVYTEGRVKASQTARPQDDELFRRFFGDRFGQGNESGRAPSAPRLRGQGSGVVVDRDGYILTNHHVVDSAQHVRVEFNDARMLDATVVGTDPASDLALLKVQATGLVAVSLGNSDSMNVGDVVLAFGNPMGVGQTVTMGIISAKGRATGAGEGGYEDFIQTDAPINHGNSGGALVNTRGELVGINAQILSNTDGNIGIGFAIPTNMARHVMNDLRKDGRVHRAQLGVTVQPMTSDLAASLGLSQVSGAIVTTVRPGSAASEAGIRQGDVIESFNGRAVREPNVIRNYVADAGPGSSATVVIRRDGTPHTLTVRLDEAKPEQQARAGQEDTDADRAALGVAVAPLTPELASRVGASQETVGLLVQDVNPDGRAAAAGIRPGDVIQQVNRKVVQSVDELRASVKSAGGRPLLLLISREGQPAYVAVRPANS